MKNLADKPFALIGVNTNSYDPKKLKDVMDKEKLNWRSFADHGGKGGGTRPICTQFKLVGTPTLYLLDHKGVIRFKWLGSPGGKKIDEAIDKLIQELEEGQNKS